MHADKRYNPTALAAAWTIIVIGAAVLVWSMASGADGKTALMPLGIRAVLPNGFLSDSPASVRVIVTDHAKRCPAAGASVAIRLTNDEGTEGKLLFQGKTNRAGTVDAKFNVPPLSPGQYTLRIEASYGAYHDQVSRQIEVRKAYNLMLVTDKPIYQPGQTIHIRALALRRPDLKPVADAAVVIEVRDPKGNKVFKRQRKTNKFGIAWADFSLADEINLGRYECRALLEDAEVTKTVTVKRYVLPKFKIDVTTAREYYLPGMRLSGSVSARYFFGKPVAGADVQIEAKTFDVQYKTDRKSVV